MERSISRSSRSSTSKWENFYQKIEFCEIPSRTIIHEDPEELSRLKLTAVSSEPKRRTSNELVYMPPEIIRFRESSFLILGKQIKDVRVF